MWGCPLERQMQVWFDPRYGQWPNSTGWRLWVTHPKGCLFNGELWGASMEGQFESKDHAEKHGRIVLQTWDEFAASKES